MIAQLCSQLWCLYKHTYVTHLRCLTPFVLPLYICFHFLFPLFSLCSPELWEQICNDLPLKLERRLCERLASVDEELWFAIVEAAHVLAFFDKIPFRVPYK